MPYIKPNDRKKYDELLDRALFDLKNATEGDLNYVITEIMHGYVETHGLCYKTLNEVMGVFESAKLEFYRRKVAAYEDKKIKENGDV